MTAAKEYSDTGWLVNRSKSLSLATFGAIIWLELNDVGAEWHSSNSPRSRRVHLLPIGSALATSAGIDQGSTLAQRRPQDLSHEPQRTARRPQTWQQIAGCREHKPARLQWWQCRLSARENRGTFLAVYVAKVRITVQAAGATVVREGHGSGEGRGPSPGDVHDIALKAAETDATKRAFATFGKPFGLEIYRQSRAPSDRSLAKLASPALPPTRLGFHPDDTTPIPRPSRYYGRRGSSLKEQFSQIGSTIKEPTPPAPPLAPEMPAASDAKIDKSVLALPEPKRRRDKSHLRFVASQPCLVCGRHPSDPHHLRFAQPRALSLKVSDEFTVPLCRGHHRQLHQTGNELAWWKTLNIDLLQIAKGLWEQTHPNATPVTHHPETQTSTPKS